MKRVALALLAAAACSNPPLQLYYQLADGTSQSCGTTDCSEIGLACESVLSIRIVDPSRPDVPYVSVCDPIPAAPAEQPNLCAIAKVDLPEVDLPRQTLEVQALVWPRAAVIDPVSGALDCARTQIHFDATSGFPVDQTPTPALGGHAYFHPGDEKTIVTLGCTNLDEVNDPVCSGTNTVDVSATVDDFDTHVSVSGTENGDKLAARLNVFVGEPVEVGGSFRLDPSHARGLALLVSNPVPSWGAMVDLMFASHICLEVLEDGAQQTTAVTCDDVGAPPYDIHGIHVSRATIQQVLAALGLSTFPDQGMTIGIVLDELDNPQAGAVVTPTTGTVQYLSANRTGLVSGATSSSGVFVSLDATFGSDFTALGTLGQTVTKPGGMIDGKVTVVVLQYPRQKM